MRTDWKRLVLYGAVVYALNVVLRLLALPGWQGLPLEFAGEYIQSTPDAYSWLAGAKGFGAASGSPLALLARSLSWITGARLGNVGFWAPVFVSSLAALLPLLWCWSLGCLEAGILAGAVAGLAPGFFGRTHLGFYDTDMVTLLFPLCVCWGWYLWMRPNLRESWLRGKEPAGEADAAALPGWYLAGPFVLGLCAHFFGLWHERVANFNELLVLPALVLALAAGKKGSRPLLTLGISLYALPLVPGWWGMLAGAVLLAALYAWPGLRTKCLSGLLVPLVLLAAALALFSLGDQPSIFWWARFYLQRYLQPFAPAWAAPPASAGPLVFPSVSHSVSEATKVGWEYLDFFSLWGWPALCAIPGFLLVLARYPGTLFLLPLAALGVGGLFLGVRMAMFGAPALGLGLGIPVYWLGSWLAGGVLRKFRWRRVLLAVGESACALALVWPCFSSYAHLPPKTVFSPQFCQALDLLQHASPENATVWTMWEWGYGVNYFALRDCFADGGSKRSSGIVYPLSLAYYADSPLFLRNVLAFCSDRPMRQVWKGMTVARIRELLQSLHGPGASPAFAAPQYFVVGFDTLQYLEWIAQSATWDFDTRRGRHVDLTYTLGAVLCDEESGVVSLGPGRPNQRVDSIDVILPNGVKTYRYDNGSGRHLLLNPLTQESYLLRTRTYQSMAVQLLLASPDNAAIGKHFELVFQNYPWVRVYKAR